MIRKWIYKLRYILIILSAILWLMGLSSSFGFWSDPTITRQISIYWNNSYQPSFDITVLRSWIPLTQALWITKNMFYFNKNNYWWWWENGLPYVFIANDDYTAWCEGYVDHYQICDSLSWNEINNCVSIPIWAWSPEIFKAFFENVSNEDYFQYWAWGGDFGGTWFFRVSSESLWQSIGWQWINWIWGCPSAWLTWSLGYGYMSFDAFQNSMWDNSPWGLPNWNWGGTIVNTTDDITNWNVVNALNSYGFSKNICFGWVSASSDYSTAIPWTWKSMFQLYQEFNPNWISNIVDWYAYYKNWFADYPYFTYSWGAYITDPRSPFLNNWDFMLSLYRLFLFGDRYWVSFYPASDIVEYCDLLLNKNPDSLYTWSDWGQVIWGAPVIDYWQSLYNLLWGDPQQIYDTWGIAWLSWENQTWDSRTFFEDLSNKFASSLDRFDDKVFWIVPSYILSVMFALIFIRLISK